MENPEFNDSQNCSKYWNKKIANFAKDLKIYENPEELLSLSLGSSETTLLKLTSAYCSFINGGKLITPKFIDRIQDSEGKTIFNSEKRELMVVIKFHI